MLGRFPFCQLAIALVTLAPVFTATTFVATTFVATTFVATTFVATTSVSARAEETGVGLTRVVKCHSTTKEFSVYRMGDEELKDGDMVSVFTSDLDSFTGLNRSTSGIWHSDQKRIELPSYWSPKEIPLSDCVQASLFDLSAFTKNILVNPKPKAPVRMYIVSYFIVGEPRPIDNLEEMIRECDAFPVKINIICNTSDGAPTPDNPMGCTRVYVLDKIIPVESHCGV